MYSAASREGPSAQLYWFSRLADKNLLSLPPDVDIIYQVSIGAHTTRPQKTSNAVSKDLRGENLNRKSDTVV